MDRRRLAGRGARARDRPRHRLDAALRAVDDQVVSRVGTGLGRPDVFNWFTEITDRTRTLRPDLVVVCVDGNDFQSYMSGVPNGTEIGPFLSSSWNREYRRRVGILLDSVAALGADVLWIGLPEPDSSNVRPRLTALNALIRAEIDMRPRHALFLNTYVVLAGRRGRFAEYLPDASGKLVKVRADDGLHLTPAGGDLVARAVVRLLATRYDLTAGAWP